MKNLTLVAANRRRDYVYAACWLRVQKIFHRSRRLQKYSLLLIGGGAMQNSSTFPFPAPATAPNPAVNEKYRRKYRRLKRIMKNLVFENAALCDHVAQIQENILLVKEERRYLLKKLLEHENDLETQMGRPCSKLNELIANSLPPKRQYKKRAVPEGGSAAESAAKGKGQTRKGRANATDKSTANKKNMSLSQTTGHPTYPMTVAGFTIYNLGEIVADKPKYNTEYTIYPVGYTVTRPYGHLKDPLKKCIYTCRVLSNGDAPRFEIIPENDPELTITGNSTDACHQTLLQCINASLDCRSIDGRPSGDWFFGLSHPTICSLLQSFPSSKRCVNYKGIKKENFANMDKENDPTLNYEALQRHITISAYHTMPEIKEEPPDELLDHSDGNSFSLS